MSADPRIFLLQGSPELKPEKLRDSDDEFEPDEAASTDDEETIAQEERLDASGDGAAQKSDREKEEIDALRRESEMPLEDLLDELPPEYFQEFGKPSASSEVKEVSCVPCHSCY